MYVFGGIDEDCSKLNDLWRLHTTKLEWERVKLKGGKAPPARSGHGGIVAQGYFFVFGGIYGMTHEMNDLWAFNLEKKEWLEVHGLIETWKLHSPIKDKAESTHADQSHNLSHAHSHTTFGLKGTHTRGRTLGPFDSVTTGSKFGDPSPKANHKHSRSHEPHGSLFSK